MRSNFWWKGQSPYFEGWYLKHQTPQGQVLALIPGLSAQPGRRPRAFLQIITNQESYWLDYPFSSFRACKSRFGVAVGDSFFSDRGIRLWVRRPGLELTGTLRYGPLTPLCCDIMGPLAILPGLECRHGILSLTHPVEGRLTLNGHTFAPNQGYLEKDGGSSFPRSYLWCQGMGEGWSAVLSAARVPLWGQAFPGCFGVVWNQGREYRFATYLGARLLLCRRDCLCLEQRGMVLRADLLSPGNTQELRAPTEGLMSRRVREGAACKVRFRLWDSCGLLWDRTSAQSGWEISAP